MQIVNKDKLTSITNKLFQDPLPRDHGRGNVLHYIEVFEYFDVLKKKLEKFPTNYVLRTNIAHGALSHATGGCVFSICVLCPARGAHGHCTLTSIRDWPGYVYPIDVFRNKIAIFLEHVSPCYRYIQEQKLETSPNWAEAWLQENKRRKACS